MKIGLLRVPWTKSWQVADLSDVDDIVQDTFLELIRAHRLMEPIEHLAAWLRRDGGFSRGLRLRDTWGSRSGSCRGMSSQMRSGS